MKYKILAAIMAMTLIVPNGGISSVADDQTSLGTEAGTAARQLKNKADEGYATGSAKVAEAQKKMEAEVQGVFQNLQQQWNVISQQAQTSAAQLSKQIQKQWDDFKKSFN